MPQQKIVQYPLQKILVVFKKKRAAIRSANYITDKINPRLEFLVKTRH